MYFDLDACASHVLVMFHVHDDFAYAMECNVWIEEESIDLYLSPLESRRCLLFYAIERQ